MVVKPLQWLYSLPQCRLARSTRGKISKVNHAFCDIDIYEQSSQTIVLRLNGEFDLVQRTRVAGSIGRPVPGARTITGGRPRQGAVHRGWVSQAHRPRRAGFASTNSSHRRPRGENAQILGFIDDTVQIDGGTAHVSVDGASAVVQQNESQRNASEKEWPAPQASRRCPEAWGPSNLRSSGRGVRAFELSSHKSLLC